MWKPEKTAKNRKQLQKKAKNHIILSYLIYGFASFFSPQKRQFMSETIVSTNILLINVKKCVESCKKQQKTAKNSKNEQTKTMFFVLNCWTYGFASFLFPQKRNMRSEMIVSTIILLITDDKYVET